MRALRPIVVVFTLILNSRGFELQDTIHTLIEENIHLHDQLDNLTQALRGVKHMLIRHSNDRDHHEHHHDEHVQHLWNEWSQHVCPPFPAGISAETHLLLEDAFCGHELHGSAAVLHKTTPLLLLSLPCLILLLISCL